MTLMQGTLHTGDGVPRILILSVSSVSAPEETPRLGLGQRRLAFLSPGLCLLRLAEMTGAIVDRVRRR